MSDPAEGGPSSKPADQNGTSATDIAAPENADLDLSILQNARDQDELERDIGRQADQLLLDQADERDQKRQDKTNAQRERLTAQLHSLEEKLELPGSSRVKNPIRQQIAKTNLQIKELDAELEQIQARVTQRHQDAQEDKEAAGDGRLPGETMREFLIRTGKITPFSKVGAPALVSADLGDVMLDAEDEELIDGDDADVARHNSGPKSHVQLTRPGFDEVYSSDASPTPSSHHVSKRRKTRTDEAVPTSTDATPPTSDAEYTPRADSSVASLDQDQSDYGESDEMMTTRPTPKKAKGKKRKAEDLDHDEADLGGVDDGNANVYKSRLWRWTERRSAARAKAIRDNKSVVAERANLPEWRQPHPTQPDGHVGDDFFVPGDVYHSLFDYQKTCVRWLWELYGQNVGGIIGDEMGLGKTIQVIAFISGLHYTGKLTKPVIVVTPATVMKQWVNEFHTWWPALRVSILHSSGSGMMDLGRESKMEDQMEEDDFEDYYSARKRTKSRSTARRIVDAVAEEGHVLITTYSGMQTYGDIVLSQEWQYAILDEGHKIRNPDAAITQCCKQLRTSNRIILSGTPMQNNLTELWSLFDFIYPMRLGTLVDFRRGFEYPIRQGGYANASNLEVETAARCAETLKEAIGPYLIQRLKKDVAKDLPDKSERVLFCPMTDTQRKAYKVFLASDEMESIRKGKRQPLYGIDILRKICNHPDLADHKLLSKKADYNYGDPDKSGKIGVVQNLLKLWKRQGNKVLLFAQHRIMLDILEKCVRKMEGINYVRMDGNTQIKDRQDLVDQFNNSPNLHVFLLTTKVGGLGVNLTGADRVVIYDPDWNPSTDLQARERAWRLGQKKKVEIYRLMTGGTIEEKIYQRQVFKQFLTNKILKDPKQRQTFNLSDMHDLFTLGDDNTGAETGKIFKGAKSKMKNASARAPSMTTATVPKPVLEAAVLQTQNEIDAIARQEEYQVRQEQEPNGEKEPVDKEKSARLLSAIFTRTGVSNVYEHDDIINPKTGKPRIRADPEIIATEARRMAAKAARDLQRAEDIARAVPAGQVTWTGTHGTVGRAEDRRGRGAAGFLSGVAASQRGGAAVAQGGAPTGVDFMTKIRDFLKTHGGSCYTQNLIAHFNRFCGTEQRTAEFKEMLKQVAVLQKAGRGRGKWILKKQYGGTAD